MCVLFVYFCVQGGSEIDGIVMFVQFSGGVYHRVKNGSKTNKYRLCVSVIGCVNVQIIGIGRLKKKPKKQHRRSLVFGYVPGVYPEETWCGFVDVTDCVYVLVAWVFVIVYTHSRYTDVLTVTV